METTKKLRNFIDEPMGNKGIEHCPGVGYIAARKLRSMNYTKASDLYKKLKRLNFDERKFQRWLQNKLIGADRGATIYRAFKAWHIKFGYTDTNDSVSEVGSPARPELMDRGGQIVQTDLTGTERDTDSTVNDIPHNNSNALIQLYTSFSVSCKNISPQYHTELKMELLDVVSKYERKSRESKGEPVSACLKF